MQEILTQEQAMSADRSGLNDCYSRICSDTSFFSRSFRITSDKRIYQYLSGRSVPPGSVLLP